MAAPVSKALHRYLYVNPRGFRNEFSVYRVPVSRVPEVDAWRERVMHRYYTNDNLDEVSWITRREAERLTRRERQNRRALLAAGQNLHCNPVGATEITDWNPEEPA